VTGRDPLWRQPDLAAQVEAGQHWLPGTATGQRETLVTSRIAARPLYLMILPGDSWLPLIAAAGTAGFFLLLTVQATLLAWSCGIAAIVSVIAWLWQSDSAPPPTASHARMAEVAEGVVLPVGARASASPSWWGTVIMLIVDATIFASFVFAHIHISMRLTVCPPPGAALPALSWTWLSCALLLASAALIEWARRTAAAQAALRWKVGAALACTAAASFMPRCRPA